MLDIFAIIGNKTGWEDEMSKRVLQQAMTDNEIIKALECCKELICKDCPIFPNGTPVLLCKSRLEIEALDLIKRLQAEIQRLNAMVSAEED